MRGRKKLGAQEALLAKALVAIKDLPEANRLLRVTLTRREIASVAKRFSVVYWELKARAAGKKVTQRALVKGVGCAPANVVRARRALLDEDQDQRFAAFVARLF